MIGLLSLLLAVLASPCRSEEQARAENALLRHQVLVLRRKVKGHVSLTNSGCWFFVQLYRWFPSVLYVLAVIQPETVVRWHRAGFRLYRRWKSRLHGGRPQIDAEVLALIRRISIENWSAHSGLADISAETRAGHRCDGFVRDADHRVQPALCLSHRPP